MKTRFPPVLLPFVLATLTLTSCYTYVPARLESVPIGSTVRTFVSTEAGLALGEQIGTGAGPLSGKLVERNDARVLLLVPAARTARQTGAAQLYQRVDVAVPDVLRIDVRVLNKFRTGGLVAALVGAITVAIVTAVGESNPGSPPLSGPNPVE